MTSIDNQFHIRWNKFEQNVVNTFQNLYYSNDFSDVTLACEDHQIQAHKTVIASCSPILHAILIQNPQSHPLIYLDGVKQDHLKAILDFMYHGEVSVKPEELEDFLDITEFFKVQGLTKEAEIVVEDKFISANVQKNENQVSLSCKSNTFADSTDQNEKTTDISEVKVKKELVRLLKPKFKPKLHCRMSTNDNIKNFSHPPVSPQDLFRFVEQRLGPPKSYSCTICKEFTGRSRSHVRNHIESVHYKGIFTYRCQLCEKDFPSKNALGVHNSALHPIILKMKGIEGKFKIEKDEPMKVMT